MEDILVPLGFFVMIGFIFAVCVWGQVQGKRAFADTIKNAYDAGRATRDDAA